jgi:hypothetical protein
MVKARERLLLIAATPQGMQLLADLTENHSPPEREQVGRSEFEQVLNNVPPPVGSPRGRGEPEWVPTGSLRGQAEPNNGSPCLQGEPHGGSPQRASRNPLAKGQRVGVSLMHHDLQGEISAALRSRIAQARARLARVAQQEEL